MSLLTLAQWLSPSFPVGGFAYSQGLETAIAEGAVTDASALEAWVGAVVEHGSGRLDCVVLAHARAGRVPVEELSDLSLAFAASPERSAELRDMGRAFVAAVGAAHGIDLPDCPYPVAIGLAARSLDIATELVLSFYLLSLVSAQVSVGVRFVPVGQSAGQAIVARLSAGIPGLARRFAALPLNGAGPTTPGADMAAMRHETLDVRHFRS
jgi:urease accessory protein